MGEETGDGWLLWDWAPGGEDLLVRCDQQLLASFSFRRQRGKWRERSCTSYPEAVEFHRSKPVAELVRFPASLLRFVSGQMPRQHRSISQVPNKNRRPFGHLKSVCASFSSCRKRRFSSCHIHVTLLKMDEHLLVIAPIISGRTARKIEQNGAFESTSRQRLMNNALLCWRWEHIRGTLIEKMIVIMTIMTIIMSVTMPSKAGRCCSLTTFVLLLHSGRIQFEASSYHKQMAWGRPVGKCMEKLCTKEISKNNMKNLKEN